MTGGYVHPAVYVWTYTTPYWQLWAAWQLMRWPRTRPIPRRNP